MEKLNELEGENKEKFYRFQCSCLTPGDAMDISVMGVGEEAGGKYIILNMYFDGTGFWSRVKYARQILCGHWSWRDERVRVTQ